MQNILGVRWQNFLKVVWQNTLVGEVVKNFEGWGGKRFWGLVGKIFGSVGCQFLGGDRVTLFFLGGKGWQNFFGSVAWQNILRVSGKKKFLHRLHCQPLHHNSMSLIQFQHLCVTFLYLNLYAC